MAFQLPANQVTNTLVAAKNELVCEFGEGANQVSGVDPRMDDLVTEIRFYIPDEEEDDEDEEDDEVEVEEEKAGSTSNDMDIDEEVDQAIQNDKPAIESLASVFAKQLKEISGAGKEQVTGDIIANLPEIAFTTPRGRYRIDMFSDCLRLHGKSYDYKIDYSAIKRLFLLPKTDDAHLLLVMAVDPPLRQGQTRHGYLIMQFPKEERIESLALQNIDMAKYEGKLQAAYHDTCTFELVAALLRGLAGQKIVVPGAFKSAVSPCPALRCTIKANEGALYVLEKNFLFLPKPTLLLPHADIARCVFSRVGASFGNPRSFDLKIQLKDDTEHAFSNITKDELDNLMEFLSAKQLPYITEKEQGASSSKKRASAATAESSGDEKDAAGDEEDESTDEDYQEGDESEEDGDFDGSDDEDDEDEDEDSDEDDDDDEEEDEDEDEEGDDE